MLLRKILLVLIAANLAYFAYAQGWMSGVLGDGTAQREPERLQKQINPEALGVSLAPSTSSNLAAAPVIAAPPTNSAVSCANNAPGQTNQEQWLVYMGPYANKELLERKKSELQRLSVSSTEVAKASLPRGLSLGRYPSEAAARGAWQALQARGIKTATVILWATPSTNPATDKNGTC